MGGKAKLYMAAIITIIVFVIFFCILAWDSSFSLSPRLLGIMPYVLFVVGIPVFTSIYILMDRGLTGFSNFKPTNATMTCMNGHTCRVWVNYRGEGWWYDFWKGGEIYHIGGEPAIIPETCPECGAQWKVPHKHDKHMTSERYLE